MDYSFSIKSHQQTLEQSPGQRKKSSKIFIILDVVWYMTKLVTGFMITMDDSVFIFLQNANIQGQTDGSLWPNLPKSVGPNNNT